MIVEIKGKFPCGMELEMKVRTILDRFKPDIGNMVCPIHGYKCKKWGN